MPNPESSMDFKTWKLMMDLVYGCDICPQPLDWVDFTYDDNPNLYRFMNRSMHAAHKHNPMRERTYFDHPDANERETVHYSFPLGRYLVKAGIPDLYLVGSREIQVIVMFWQGNDRLGALKQTNIWSQGLDPDVNQARPFGTHLLRDTDKVELGDTMWYSYQVNDDARGELFADIQLLQDVNALKTVYRRMKMWGVKSRQSLALGTTSYEIHLPENSPPRALMIFAIEETVDPATLGGGAAVTYPRAFQKPTGMYFYKMDDCLITVTAVHNGKIKTENNISFDQYGTTEVREYFKSFERMQMAGKLFGVEDNMFTYKQWLDQIPAIILEYDSSQADIVATARTGQIQSVLQVTVQITNRAGGADNRVFPVETRLMVVAVGDEFIRKPNSTAPYQVLTGREVLSEGFLIQGVGFTAQNTGNIAKQFGFDRAIDSARQ